MATKIYTADIKIGETTLESVVVKRLPVNILLSDNHFMKRLELSIGAKKWTSIPRKNGTPEITIYYLKYIGDTGAEPKISYL